MTTLLSSVAATLGDSECIEFIGVLDAVELWTFVFSEAELGCLRSMRLAEAKVRYCNEKLLWYFFLSEAIELRGLVVKDLQNFSTRQL